MLKNQTSKYIEGKTTNRKTRTRTKEIRISKRKISYLKIQDH